jgi:RNA ligase
MHYKFPRIEHINDVLPAIEGRDEFFVGEREWGKVINYMVNLADTFPLVATAGGSAKMREEQSRLKALRRECRGLLFYPDGRIMARRLHKFFNLNERDETLIQKIDFTKPHVILEKLDGSMITPVMTKVDDQVTVRWGTKMGLTDVAAPVEEYVSKNVRYEKFALCMMVNGYTPIFEWCSRKQKIVIDYAVDSLVLTAVRNTVTGEYTLYDDLLDMGQVWEIDVVKAYAGTAANMEMLVEETRDLKGAEGYVIRFDDGMMLKLKAEAYISMHHAKDSMTLEKNVIDLLINDKLDDVKGFMQDEDRNRVEAFENRFWLGVVDTVDRYDAMWREICAHKLDRKQFALERMPALKNTDPFAAGIVFGLFDGKLARDLVVDIIRKNCNTSSKVDSARSLWGGHVWQYSFEGDN